MYTGADWDEIRWGKSRGETMLSATIQANKFYAIVEVGYASEEEGRTFKFGESSTVYVSGSGDYPTTVTVSRSSINATPGDARRALETLEEALTISAWVEEEIARGRDCLTIGETLTHKTVAAVLGYDVITERSYIDGGE